MSKISLLNALGKPALCAALFSCTLLLCSTPAYAIPSPDLVINLSASVAQLLGLLSVVFGGFAMKKRGGG